MLVLSIATIACESSSGFLVYYETKISKIVINDVIYDVVDGGTTCKDCTIRNLCMINGFADGVTIDCTSVHLVNKGNYEETK